MTIDPSGTNVFVAGSTYGNLGGQTNNGSSDAFLAKFSAADGAHRWTVLHETTEYDESHAVTIDPSGANVFVAGETNGNLGGQTNAGNDAFLVKFDMPPCPAGLGWSVTALECDPCPA